MELFCLGARRRVGWAWGSGTVSLWDLPVNKSLPRYGGTGKIGLVEFNRLDVQSESNPDTCRRHTAVAALDVWRNLEDELWGEGLGIRPFDGTPGRNSLRSRWFEHHEITRHPGLQYKGANRKRTVFRMRCAEMIGGEEDHAPVVHTPLWPISKGQDRGPSDWKDHLDQSTHHAWRFELLDGQSEHSWSAGVLLRILYA